MLGHQLGQHLVLVLDLLFQKLDALLFRGMILAAFALEGGSPVLEELFLPTIKHRWLEPILLAEIRDRNLVEQVPPQNDHFLFPGVMLALFSHTSSPFILTEERSSPFPAEAGQDGSRRSHFTGSVNQDLVSLRFDFPRILHIICRQMQKHTRR